MRTVTERRDQGPTGLARGCLVGAVSSYAGETHRLIHLTSYPLIVCGALLSACGAPTGTGGPVASLGGANAGHIAPAAALVCPAGFSAETDQRAKNDCHGTVDVQIVRQSGGVAAICVNEAGATYKCVARQSFNEICAPNGVERVTREEIKCYAPSASAGPDAGPNPPPATNQPTAMASTKTTACQRAIKDFAGAHYRDHQARGSPYDWTLEGVTVIDASTTSEHGAVVKVTVVINAAARGKIAAGNVYGRPTSTFALYCDSQEHVLHFERISQTK